MREREQESQSVYAYMYERQSERAEKDVHARVCVVTNVCGHEHTHTQTHARTQHMIYHSQFTVMTFRF